MTKLNVKEWGDAVIDALIEQRLVASVPDLYDLVPGVLAQVLVGDKRVGGSTAGRLVRNLHERKTVQVAEFLGALGIDLCGRTVCQMVVDAGFSTLPAMQKATVTQLAAIPGLGPVKAKAFVEGLAQVRGVIDALLAKGLAFKSVEGSLTGQSFCFTEVRDRQLEHAIAACGGRVKNSVSRGLTFLVAADPKGNSTKLMRARQYGVTVVSLDEARALVGRT